MFERLAYFVRRALRNMRQSPLLCAAAVGTVAVALTLLAFFAIIVLNVQQLTRQWSEQVQVVAYIETVPDARRLQSWIDDVRRLPDVSSVTYVSRQQALERFRQRLGADADLLTGVEADILPASLEIALRETSRNRQGVEAVVGQLRRNPAFSDLRYGQEWLERFESFVAMLRLLGGVLGGFLLFAALFIVANTIRLTLYSRRDEIEIMALVGGTPLFIKTPFLLEGAIQGALGGGLALSAAYLLYGMFLRDGLGTLLLTAGGSGIGFLPLTWQLLLLGTGILLGLTGSLLSLRRLVRV
jgi:cell division transport system permease protein